MHSSLGLPIVRETNKKIAVVREKMKAAQDWHKSYEDQHWKDKEFIVGEHILVKVSSIQGVVRFGQKRGKLSTHYIGPFEILECVGKVSYRLTLPPKLSEVHNVFHVSMLKEYHQGPTPHVIDFDDIEVNDTVSYTERPVQILGRKTKKLQNKEIPLVKV